ncbi:hypothetical protein L6250_01595 [Candidatus Parcubacteria bacterium]|nr:hypothetical protein [Patescibacteria group bacterium]MBU4466988.1 hypothetical protein [Patescibacteria group bacterium]MCG2688309.1 hypothetical protein [Candidatus Parcubacteria bacterium]
MSKLKYIIFGLLILFLASPILNFFQGEIWLGWGYSNHYFNLLDEQNSPFYLWKEMTGEPSSPHLLNLVYYWPLKLLLTATANPYASWLIYVYLVFSASALFFSIYVKKLVPSLSSIVALLLGLLYASYIPLNYEGFNLRIAAAIIPLLLWLLLKVFESRKISIPYFILFSVLALNLILTEYRGFIAFLTLAISQIAYFFVIEKNKKSLLRISVFLLLAIGASLILFLPTKYAQDIVMANSTQISVPVQESVLTRFFSPLKFLFHPQPAMKPDFATSFFLFPVFFLMLAGLCQMARKKEKLLYLILFLGAFYFLFLNRFFLNYITLNLAYGQLFRSWRIAQYLAAFLIPICLVKFNGKKELVLLAIVVFSYFSFSVYLFNQSLVFVKAADIIPYLEVNKFLEQDKSDFKVVWAPEMGWFGQNSSPFWVNNKETMQGFPESISSKPGYWHYTNQLTHFYTWLLSGIWKSQIQENQNVSNLLNILGVKYVVVHNDVPGYLPGTKRIINNLSSSEDFKLVWQKDYLSVFENSSYKTRIWAASQENAFFCDYGLKCLGDFYDKADSGKTVAFVADTELKALAFEKVDKIFGIENSKDNEEKFYNLVIGKTLSDKDSKAKVIFSKEYFKYQNYAACLSDTHHGTYHDFFSQEQPADFANSFWFQNCLFFLGPRQYSKISLPVSIENNEYVILIRYLQQNGQAGFRISFPNFTREFWSTGQDGQSRYFYFKNELEIKQKIEGEIVLSNLEGINFVSLIALIPKQEFEKNLNFFKSNLTEIGPADSFPNSKPTIGEIKRINPSKWQISVFSDKPFALNFAESYNPFWKVKIFKNSEKLGESYSVQSYASINSFFIDATGNLKLEIVYEPQEKYYQYLLNAFLGSFVLTGLYYFLGKSLFSKNHN